MGHMIKSLGEASKSTKHCFKSPEPLSIAKGLATGGSDRGLPN